MFNRIFTYLRRFRRDEIGSALVEMTIITPLMISLSAGVFEFGNLFHKKLLIEAGLRDGARYAARCNPVFVATLGINCETVAKNIAVYSNAAGTGAVRVTGWDPNTVTVDRDYLITSATDGGGNMLYRSTEANVLTVRASTTFNYTGASLLSYLGLNPIVLSASHEERYVGW